MKSQLVTATATTTITFAAIGMIGWLTPLHPAAGQEAEPAKPTVPQEGVGGPKAIDLDAGAGETASGKKAGAVSRLDLPLFEIVAGAEDFTTLAGALRAAGMDDRLKEAGPFTLLAPDNDAFAALPEGVLQLLLKPENRDLLSKLLSYHLLPKKLMGSDLVPGKLITSQGEALTVAAQPEGKATIQGAGFGTSDIEAKNGVIHVVNAVLIPPSVNIEDYATPKAAE